MNISTFGSGMNYGKVIIKGSTQKKKNGNNNKKNTNQNVTIMKPAKIISAASYMAKIQAAKSSWGVANVMAKARADVKAMKNSGASDAEVQKALRIVSSVVEKGTAKMARLRNENRLKQQKTGSKGKEKERLKKEIKRKQRVRRAIEKLDTLDPRRAVIEMGKPSQLEEQKEEMMEKQFEALGIQETKEDSMEDTEGRNLDVSSESTEIAAEQPASFDISL